MSRFVLVRATIIALACLGIAFAPHAKADGTASTYRAPFQRDVSMGARTLTPPCDAGLSPVTARKPDASTGRMDSSEGVRATRCSAMKSSVSRTWILGPAPDALIGKAARITAVVETDSTSIDSSGTANRSGAITLQIGSADIWTLVGFDCASTCTRTQPTARIMRFETTVSSLPATLRAVIGARVSLSRGSGVAAVGYLGTLTAVTVTPALG